MANTVHIKGAREMEMVLRQLPQAVAKQTLTAALRQAAQPILDEARARAPVGTEAKGRVRFRRSKRGKVTVSNYGKLRPSLKIVTVPGKLTAHSATVAVTVGKAFWGMFVEFGTRFMSSKPFMRPAFESQKMNALSRLGKALGEQIEKTAAKLAKTR